MRDTRPSPHVLPRFGSSVTKSVHINKTDRNPKIRSDGPRPLAVQAQLTLKNTPLPTCYSAGFRRSRSNGMRVVKEIRLKNLTPRVPPFKVIGTDMDRSVTYNFLLKFHSNNGPISDRFYRATLCVSADGRTDRRTPVRLSVRPSVCHVGGLYPDG